MKGRKGRQSDVDVKNVTGDESHQRIDTRDSRLEEQQTEKNVMGRTCRTMHTFDT